MVNSHKHQLDGLPGRHTVIRDCSRQPAELKITSEIKDNFSTIVHGYPLLFTASQFIFGFKFGCNEDSNIGEEDRRKA